MKKRVLLLITLVVSLFIYSGRVNAVEELTCIYGYSNSYTNVTRMMVRDSEGNISFYENGDLDNEKKGWAPSNFSSDSATKEKLQSITECYKIMKLPCDTYGSQYYELSDADYSTADPFCSYLKLHKELRSNPSNHITRPIDDTVNIEETYNGMCSYAHINQYYSGGFDINIFFNDERVDYDINADRVVELDFDIDEFLRFYKGYCPPTIYAGSILAGQEVASLKYSLAPLHDTFNSMELTLVDSKYFNNYQGRIIEEDLNIDDCRDLIGKDVYDKLNDYFKIIRLVIPILLVAFGIFDFTKAVFGNEEDMKKARKKFIMRIVAAILFFLLPILLKLILTIANTVWKDINPETCISTK